ncbi:MAG: hypothetical protein L0Z62_29200 [Gemmataceae bacterium]|nr:hypothetical protein [Gemmataceae bacterium]
MPPTMQGQAVRCSACGQAMMVPGQPAAVPVAQLPPVQPTATTAQPPPAPAPAAAPPRQPPPFAPPPRMNVPPSQSGPPSFASSRTAPAPRRPIVSPTDPALGQVVKEYAPTTGYWVALGIAGGVSLFVIILAILVFPTNKGLLIAPTIVLGAAGLFLTGTALTQALRGMNLQLLLCEHGFQYRRFSRCVSARWQDVAAVLYAREYVPSGKSLFVEILTVTLRDGKEIGLPSNLGDLHEIYTYLNTATRPLLVQQAQAALDRGESLRFGDDLRLQPTGLVYKGQHRGWEYVPRAVVCAAPIATTPGSRSTLAVRLEGLDPAQVWCLGASLVPNCHVLLELLESRFRVPVVYRVSLAERRAAPDPGVDTNGKGCPWCGGPVGMVANPALGASFGLIGALISAATAGSECRDCGRILRSELAPPRRPAPRRRSVIPLASVLGGGAAGLLVLLFVFAFIERGKHAPNVEGPPGGAQLPDGQKLPDGEKQPEGIPPQQPVRPPGQLRTIKTAGRIRHARFAPDGSMVATLGDGATCELWSPQSGDLQWRCELKLPGRNNWLAFSGDGKYVIAWDGEGPLFLREARTGTVRTTIDPGGWDAGMNMGAFSPAGNLLVVNRGATIKFWTVPDGQPAVAYMKRVEPDPRTHYVSSLIAAGGNTLITGAYRSSPAGGIERIDQVWDLANGGPPRRLTALKLRQDNARLTMSPDGRLVMAHSDQEVEVVDWAKDQLQVRLTAKDFTSAAFTADSKAVVTGHRDGSVGLYAVPTGEHLGRLQAGRPGDEVSAVGVSPDGRLLATGANDELTLWTFAEALRR